MFDTNSCKMVLEAVNFLVPKADWPSDLNSDAPTYHWTGNRFGKWNWTLQTHQRLSERGFSCGVVHDIDANGIVIGHRDVIPTSYKPHKQQLLVCIAAERGLHPFANFNILQNPLQESRVKQETFERIWKRLVGRDCAFIRYWTQPGLIPRTADRGDQFVNVVFMGVEDSLSPEFRGERFRLELERLGLRWLPVHDKSKWPDYSEVDAVVAVRAASDLINDRKPATKLYNAWLAGVPAILGAESAFRYEGVPGQDYLEASSSSDVISWLIRLRDDPGLRWKIVERGRERAESLSYEIQSQQWVDLIDNELQPLYEEWTSLPTWRREVFFRLKRLQMRVRHYNRKITRLAANLHARKW